MTRTYSELIRIPTFIERYRYLKLNGRIGEETFGFDRWLNQILYTRSEWRSIRKNVIVRDFGCDLADVDREISGLIIVHHMNPINKEMIINRDPLVFDPEYLISCADTTHKAIHYGNESILITEPIIRRKNDMCPWR